MGILLSLLSVSAASKAVGTWSVISLPPEVGQVSHPTGIAVDNEGNLYVTDATHGLQKCDAQGNWSVVSALPPDISMGYSVAVDNLGNRYDVDQLGDRILMKDFQGNSTTLADRGSELGQVTGPIGIAVDEAGSLYVIDASRLQKRDSNGNWTLLAADLMSPFGIAVDKAGNLYVSEQGISRIRKRDALGAWSVLADAGQALGHVSHPYGLTIDDSGILYVADWGNNRVQKRDAEGKWSIIAETGRKPGQVNLPGNMSTDAQDNLYVVDDDNDRVLKRDTQGNWSIFASEEKDPGHLLGLTGIAADQLGNLYITTVNVVYFNIGQELHSRLQKKDAQGNWSVLAATDWNVSNSSRYYPWADATDDQLVGPIAVAVDDLGNLFIADQASNRVLKRNPQGNWSLLFRNNAMNIALDSDGNVYVPTHSITNQDIIVRQDPQGNLTELNSISYDHHSLVSLIHDPRAVAVDHVGNVYVADGVLHKRDAQGNWTVLTTAGTAVGQVHDPKGLTIDSKGNLYVSDRGNHRIQKYTVSEELLAGDLDGDGKVTVQDATLSLQITVGTLTPSTTQQSAGDVNGDGKLNLQDTTFILRKAVGL
jgi:DNA-binding beta-propeller fold protein YncE